MSHKKMSHEKAKSYVYRNTVKPMFSSSKEFSGTMDIRPEFSKCDHGDCYSFVFGLPFYEENAQGQTSHNKFLKIWNIKKKSDIFTRI